MKILSKQKLERELGKAQKIFEEVGLNLDESSPPNDKNSVYRRVNDIIKAFQYWEKLRIGILPERPIKLTKNISYLTGPIMEMFNFAQYCKEHYLQGESG